MADAIASIALLIGVIGVYTAMFFNELERRREVGLLKMMGFSEKQILITFALEGTILGLISSVVGVILGSLGLLLLTQILGSNLGLVLPGWLILMTIIITTGLSFILSLFPSWIASKIVFRRCLILSKEILELKAVSKAYSEVNGNEILVLDIISLKLNSKSLSMVVGPTGSGKSTLLRVAGLLESPSSGSVIFANEDHSNLKPKERLNLIRHEMGFVPPYPSLLPYLTILENVMLPMIKKNKEVAVELLKDLGINSRESYPKQISVEEQQQASIARALINSPRLILVDEPTASLSQSSSTNIMEILKNLKKDHSVLIFTDDAKLLEYSDVVFKLNKGVLSSK